MSSQIIPNAPGAARFWQQEAQPAEDEERSGLGQELQYRSRKVQVVLETLGQAQRAHHLSLVQEKLLAVP